MSIKYSKGIVWLDDCRIPFVNDDDIKTATPGSLNATGEFSLFGLKSGNELNKQGRFTPNLLVCDDMLNDGIKPNKGHRAKGKVSGYGEFGGGKSEYHGVGEYMEVDSKSRYYDLDLWFDKLIKELN
jgi:hypothetical protein